MEVELERYKLDVIAPARNKLAGEGTIKRKYTYFYSRDKDGETLVRSINLSLQ